MSNYNNARESLSNFLNISLKYLTYILYVKKLKIYIPLLKFQKKWRM